MRLTSLHGERCSYGRPGTRGFAVFLACALLTATGSSAVYDVGVFDYFFEPFELSLRTGDTVVWTAYGYGHALIADSGEFDSFNVWPGTIPALNTFRHTFHQAGAYSYYSRDYGGPEGAGMSATISVIGPTTNQLPARPANLFPTNVATAQPIRAELRANDYVDGDPGDYHHGSQWVVRRASDNQVVYDSSEVSDNGLTSSSKTNRFLPPALLAYGTTYFWQVRYKDSFGGWSDYSTPTTFTTLAPTLRAVRRESDVVFTWPTNSAGFALEFSTNLAGAKWDSVDSPTAVVEGQNTVSEATTNHVRFYRLKRFPL